jgi:hypothetical protein
MRVEGLHWWKLQDQVAAAAHYCNGFIYTFFRVWNTRIHDHRSTS